MATAYRYRLQPYGGSRGNRYACPSCGQAHQFTRYVDTQTSEQLPAEFGQCNRLDQCGYRLTPYEAGPTGQSYAQTSQATERLLGTVRRMRPSRLAPLLCLIPEDVVQQSLRHYERNVFAQLLQQQLGQGVARELLHRFEIGTSAYWPGATVFWQRDELGRVRGGQVVLFDASGHTAKRVGADGKRYRCTTWMHTAMTRRYQQQGHALPTWLSQYLDPANEVQKTPSLYGLGQLANAPVGQPVALVEAPKTAVLCTAYFPQFSWLATGSLSNLTSERLRPLKGYQITLFPDASPTGSAFQHWSQKAAQLRPSGFTLTLSSLLEHGLTSAQQAQGYDLADVLLDQWPGYPPSWDSAQHSLPAQTAEPGRKPAARPPPSTVAAPQLSGYSRLRTLRTLLIYPSTDDFKRLATPFSLL